MSVLTILFMRVRASEPKTNVKLLQTFIQKEKLFCIITQKTFNMKTSLMGIPDPLPIIALFHDLCMLVSWRDYERCSSYVALLQSGYQIESFKVVGVAKNRRVLLPSRK